MTDKIGAAGVAVLGNMPYAKLVPKISNTIRKAVERCRG
jgi:hypothetical protein